MRRNIIWTVILESWEGYKGVRDKIREELKTECEENPIDETKIKPKNPSDFRFNAKSVLLTYAQCDKPKEW